MSEVKESSDYENCMDILGTQVPKSATLSEFFGEDDVNEDVEWKTHWVGMPEFTQEDNPPYKRLIVNFRTEDDYMEFSTLIGQKLTNKTKSIWHPKLDRDENSLKRWFEDE
jgi:hypothetical protein